MAKKYALLIGNNKYDDHRFQTLNTSIANIEVLQQILQCTEIFAFDEVTVLPNPTFKDSMRELSLLFSEKNKDDLLLFYFCGYGVRDHVGDLFFPIQDTECGLFDGTAIPASQLKAMANKSASRRQVWVLDCCYSEENAGEFKGIEQFISKDMFDVKAYGREIISATYSLQSAIKGDSVSANDTHTILTHNLVESLEKAKSVTGSETVTLEELYQSTLDLIKPGQSTIATRYWCDDAEERINLGKNPRLIFSLPDELINNLTHTHARIRSKALHQLQVLLQEDNALQRQAVYTVLLQRKKMERNRFVYQQIQFLLKQYDSIFRSLIKNTDGEPTKNLTNLHYESGTVFRDRLKNDSQGPEMVVIPSGEFSMGDIENIGRDSEKPVHDVTFTKRFALAKYPITFAEYDYFCEQCGIEKPNDNGWGRLKRPLINVSWKEAVAYAQWLSDETGNHYRLPSETEWEYAARADTQTTYWWGNQASRDYANYDAGETTPVDQFKPNRFGLHDMLGNIWEWVEDCYHDNYNDMPEDGSAWMIGSSESHVLRGGSWYSKPWYVRSSNRFRFNQQSRNTEVGFRLAQDL